MNTSQTVSADLTDDIEDLRLDLERVKLSNEWLRSENEKLREALRECVTDTPGAACYNTGRKTRRLEAINVTVSAALSTP